MKTEVAGNEAHMRFPNGRLPLRPGEGHAAPWLSNPAGVPTPLTHTQEGVNSTSLNARLGISCQDAGPVWRTTGGARFKTLVFKDALL